MTTPKVEIRLKSGSKGISVKDYDLFIGKNRISQKTMSKALFGDSLSKSLDETIKSFEDAAKRAQAEAANAPKTATSKITQKEVYVQSDDPIISWMLKVDDQFNFKLLDGEEGEESNFIIDGSIAKTYDDQLMVWETAEELINACNQLRLKMAEHTAKRINGPYTVGVSSDGSEDIYEYVNGKMTKVTTTFLESEKVVQTILNLTRTQQEQEMRYNPSLRSIKLNSKHLNGLVITYQPNNSTIKFNLTNINLLKPLAQKVVNQLIQHLEIGESGIIGSQMLIKMNSKK